MAKGHWVLKYGYNDKAMAMRVLTGLKAEGIKAKLTASWDPRKKKVRLYKIWLWRVS